MKSTKIFIAGIILFASMPAFSITGDEALTRFRARMLGLGKLTGVISWTAGSGQTMTGSFKYMAPDKIYVKFSNPSGKVVVSNGRKLWVYNPGINICGIQDLGGGSSSGGIAGLTKDYNAIVTSQGSGGYTIKLKNNTAHYTEIVLLVDSSFLLKKAIFKGKSDEAFSFTLSNVSTSAGVMRSLFEFSVPANAQVVKNPLNIK